MLSHKIRRATEEDLNDILRLFKSTVEAVNSKDYQPEQILVWKNRAICKDKWLEKIVDQYFIISINEFDVTGFASITKDGYLDFMYVSKDYQRMGIAKKLYRELETFARTQ